MQRLRAHEGNLRGDLRFWIVFGMSSQPSSEPHIPKTPLKIFVKDQSVPVGPFYVEAPGLAGSPEMRDIADEEIAALAHIILNAYLEWKQL